MTNGSSAEKDVAFYGAVVAAWVETRMEADRTIVLLSSGAIGLLCTILTTTALPARWLVWVYGVAFAAFTVAIVICLWTFIANATYLENVVQGGREGARTLDARDRWSVPAFGLGLLAVAVIGIASACYKLNLSGSAMTLSTKALETKTVETPCDGGQKSLSGIENLRPTAPATAPAGGQQNTAPPPSAPEKSE